MPRNENTPHQPTVRIPNRDDFSLTSARTGPHITPSSSTVNNQKNVADIARSQIDHIYSNDHNHLMAVEAEPETNGYHQVEQPINLGGQATPIPAPTVQSPPQISKFAHETDQSKSIEADNPYQRSYESTD